MRRKVAALLLSVIMLTAGASCSSKKPPEGDDGEVTPTAAPETNTPVPTEPAEVPAQPTPAALLPVTLPTWYQPLPDAMPEGFDELSEALAKVYGEWTDTNYTGLISDKMPNTALLGNGDIGIVSGGDAASKNFYISKSDFWEYNNAPMPIGGVILQAQNPAEGNTKFNEKQLIDSASIQTAMSIGGAELNMKTWTAPEGRNLLITEVTLLSDAACDLQVVTWANAENAECPVTADVINHMPVVTRSTPNKHQSDTASYTSKAAIAAKVVGTEVTGTGLMEDAGKAYLNFTIEPSQTVYIITAVGGGGKTYDNTGVLTGDDPISESAALLEQVAEEEDIEAIAAAHEDWWKRFWLASYITFDQTNAIQMLLQRYYYGALYIFGCTTNKEGVPPGLYGIWHTKDGASWKSDYHLNYNFIATWYGSYAAGRGELSRSAIQAVLDYLPEAERRAGTTADLKRINAAFVDEKIQKGDIDPVNGIQGALLFPVGIGPYGMTLDDNYHNQTLNAGFTATMLIEYYEYTRDAEFLANDLYPYLKKCLRFHEVWLDKGEDGRYMLYAAYNEGTWSVNAAAELGILRGVLSAGIKYAGELGIDEEKQALWQDIYDNLAAQPTMTFNGNEVYSLSEKEFKDNQWVDMTDPVPQDGNILSLEGVYPSNYFGHFSEPEELALLKNTIDIYSSRGGWGQNNNFPKMYGIAAKTRYPAEEILKNLASQFQSKMVQNLRVNDNTHGVEKTGAIDGLQSMMLLQHKGIVALFGNWPANYSISFIRLRAPGGFVFEASFDGNAGETASASFTSTLGGTIKLASPWSAGMVVTDGDGTVLSPAAEGAPGHPEELVYTIDTTAGMSYTLTKAE